MMSNKLLQNGEFGLQYSDTSIRSLLKVKQLSVPTTWELPLARSVLEFLI